LRMSSSRAPRGTSPRYAFAATIVERDARARGALEPGPNESHPSIRARAAVIRRFGAPPGRGRPLRSAIGRDDRDAFEDLDYVGGPNRVSLGRARKSFRRYGASERRLRRFTRLRSPDFVPTTN